MPSGRTTVEEHEAAGQRLPADGPLRGLSVVELSGGLASSFVGLFLADAGAEVVQVEPPGGSPVRGAPGYPFLARGKQSIRLDLHDPSDRDLALGLGATADVVVESWRPGVADRLGLGYDVMRSRNPRLVHASITGFGREGPYAAIPGYESLVGAKLGLLTSFAPLSARRGPTFVATPYCSFSAAHTALHGIMAALYERERSGLGQRVEATLAQGLAALDPWNLVLRHVALKYPGAYMSADPVDEQGRPNSSMLFRLLVALTSDGRWLQFSQVQPRLFQAFMRALGLEWMFDDPEWKTAPEFEDTERRIAFWEQMLRAARQKSVAEWDDVFDADPNVWAEVFRSGTELLHHPQLVHNGQVVEVDDPALGPVRQPGPLVTMSATPCEVHKTAPMLDQHGMALRSRVAMAGGAITSSAEQQPPPGGLPLEGVTVLELGTFYAAPYGVTLLTDLGARVVKLEPLDGDPMRMLVPFPEAGGVKVLQGKESVALDLQADEAREIIHALARKADLVLQSFRAGVAERLGIDAATLCALNPDLVYVNAPGYGIDGPCGHRPAFAPTIGAGAGFGRRNAAGSLPQRADLSIEEIEAVAPRMFFAGGVGAAQPDGLSALGVGSALLLGLLARQRGGGGQTLLTTMMSTAAHVLGEDMVEYAGRPAWVDPDAGLHGLSALYRLYPASEGWVFLATPTERDWTRLVAALADLGALADDRFATAEARREHDDALVEVLQGVFATRPAAAWEDLLLPTGVGCVAVAEAPVEEVLLGEASRTSGYVVDVLHPTFEEHPRLAPLVRFSRSVTVAQPSPVLGQHTDEVLRELGYDDARITELRVGGIVRSA